MDTNGSLSHAGVTLVAQGTVKPQLSARSVGIFEAFYSSIKPVTLLHEEVEMVSGGKFPPGVTELPFSFDVDAVDGQVRLLPQAARALFAPQQSSFVVPTVVRTHNMWLDRVFWCVTATGPSRDVPWRVRQHYLHNHMHHGSWRLFQVHHCRNRVHR